MNEPVAGSDVIHSDNTSTEAKLPPAVRAHTPNQVFTFSDGREYTVNMNGSWVKTKEELKGSKRIKASR